jgi:Tfp pilus assembly protein PilE
MPQNCFIKNITNNRPGFTLIELQVYLGIMAIMAVMVCQVALMYHNLYDKIAISAQDSIMMLAAVFQVNESFDNSIMHKKKDGQLPKAAFLKKNKLMGVINNRQQVILDGVNDFDSKIDMQDTIIHGARFSCDYKGKQIVWYRAALTKAFSCSSSS